jgi:hypothetical protein
MSRGLLEFMDRFALADANGRSPAREEHARNARRAAAGAQF